MSKFAVGDTAVLAEPYRSTVETTVEKVGRKYVSVANSRRQFDLDGVQVGEIYGIAARIYTTAEYAEALRRNDVTQRINQHIGNSWRGLPTPTLEKLLAVLDEAAGG